MLLPNLIIAGAPKCGTSSLFRWLTDHPQVGGSTMKETYFFVEPGSHMHDPACHFTSGGLSKYSELFDPLSCKGKTIIVEATPGYMYSPLAIRELPQLPTRPVMIFVLREPVSQLKSLFRYFQGNWDWVPNGMSFNEFIQASQEGLDLFKGNELARHAVHNACYVDALSKWREECPESRLLIFLFEDLVADNKRFMIQLANRLGLYPEFYETYDFPSENETYAVRLRLLQKVNLTVRPHLPQGWVYRKLRTAYRFLNTSRPTKHDWKTLALEAKLSDYFQEANERLANEFGVDLSEWHKIHAERRDRF
jgi:hypothetical protein